MSGKKQNKPNPAREAFQAGCGLVNQNPVLSPLMKEATPILTTATPWPKRTGCG